MNPNQKPSTPGSDSDHTHSSDDLFFSIIRESFSSSDTDLDPFPDLVKVNSGSGLAYKDQMYITIGSLRSVMENKSRSFSEQPDVWTTLNGPNLTVQTASGREIRIEGIEKADFLDETTYLIRGAGLSIDDQIVHFRSGPPPATSNPIPPIRSARAYAFTPEASDTGFQSRSTFTTIDHTGPFAQLLGVTALELGKYDAAVRHFEQHNLTNGPSSCLVHEAIARIKRNAEQDREKAETLLHTAVQAGLIEKAKAEQLLN